MGNETEQVFWFGSWIEQTAAHKRDQLAELAALQVDR
jgi:hypothetical protein